MSFSHLLRTTFLSLIILGLAACSPSGPVAPTAVETTSDEIAAAEATIDAMETQLASVQQTEEQNPTATPTPEPSQTPSPAPIQTTAKISVSQATNCRRGPDPSFELQAVLTVGQKAEVLAKSSVDDYWYIVNPDDPDDGCWLLGTYATIEGDTESLAVQTPEPTPTPQVGFDVWFHGFASCGSNELAIFAIRNGGSVRLWSGWIGAYTVGDNQKLYGPVLDRHPFSETATETCPPGHGNELYPGEVDYVLVPLKSTPSETNAYVEFKLCSADHGGGDCVTKIGYFYIP